MLEYHPYGEFIPANPCCMIIGSFPIGKFSNPKRRHEIKPHEFEFFFGGEKNQLWKLLSSALGREIHSKEDVVAMLEAYGIGVGDVITACRRQDGRASDTDLYDIVWNKSLLQKIDQHKIHTLYFTSRKVEQWFNRLFPESHHLKKVTLISPSAQSVRGLSRLPAFTEWRKRYPERKAVDFIYADYRRKFSRMKSQNGKKHS